MILFLIAFITFFSFYYYLAYQVIILNDLNEIFSQTAIKAQADLKGHVELVLEDLAKSYYHILLIISCAAILSFIWILLLKYNAKIIIWASIFSLPIILTVGAYYSIKTYLNLQKANGQDGDLLNGDGDSIDGLSIDDQQALAFDKALQTILTAELLSYVHNETLWLVLSIILCSVLAISVLLLYSLRERVRLSIALIRQASKAINGVKSTLVFPIIPRALGISQIIFGIMISLLIISASHPTYHIVGGPRNGKPCHPRSFNRTSHSAVIPAHHGSPLPQSVAQIPRVQPSLPPSLSQQQPTSRLFSNQNPPSLPKNNVRNNVRFSTIAGPNDLTINNNTVRQANASRLAEGQCVVNQPLSRQHVWKYHALNLFATLWLIHFISGISQTTLAGAFASYYWAHRKPRDIPFFAVTRSFFRVLRYHLGDIAFGSFLIATIRYVRIVIEFIDNRLRRKNNNGDANNPARSVACFFRIFFWLLDRFLKYIDRNAYIIMSMYGEGYLASAKRAVGLLYENSTRAIVLDYVTYFVLLVSRLLITGIAGYVTAQDKFTAGLHYRWLPILLVVLGTYFISKGLFSVYSMAVDTLFICFLIDTKNNDGSIERPFFMSRELRKIVTRSAVRTD